MIKGHGPSSANIFLIEDSASTEDAATGYAISGSGAKMLNSRFAGFNYKVEQTYRTLLIKERLPYNGNEKKKFKTGLDATLADLRVRGINHEEVVLEELLSVRPNIIMPLGEMSLRFLTGYKGIYKYRGSILPLREDFQQKFSHPIKVIPTYGPQIINENWTARAYIPIDIGKAIKYKDHAGEVKPDGLLHIARTAEDLHNYLSRQVWKNNFLVFDIETMGIHSEGYLGIPICIALCLSDNESICVPLLDDSIDMANRVILWQKVAQLLASPIPKINQNIKYDWTILERFCFKVNNVTGDDTVLRAGLIYPELPKNLGFLTSIYTEMPYHKDEGKNEKDRNKVYLYCAKDALATRRVYNGQTADLKELGLDQLNCTTKKLFFIYKKMDERGIKVDDEERQRLIAKYRVLLNIHMSVLSQLANKDINPRSPLQVRQLLIEELRYPHRVELDEDTLEELASLECRYFQGPLILKEIIYIRKIYKILEYLRVILHPDLRWRANYNLAGTENGRTSCNPSIDQMFELIEGIVVLKNAGRSLQTITKHGFRIGDEIIGTDVRRIFVPTPGFVLCETDLSQAEARVDAVLSTDYNLLDKFTDPGIHKLTGSWLYDCAPEDIKKGTLEYHLAKTFRHAAERNIGAKTLSMTTHRPVKECEKLLVKLHEYQRNIREVFHRDIIKEVTDKRFLVSPHGRRRDFFARPDYKMHNEAISYIPQAVVGDLNKFSFIPILEEMPQVLYLNEAHDSSLVEIRRDEVERYAALVKKHLEIPIDFRQGSIYRDFQLTIPCETTWSDTCWYEPEMKKV